jgi:ribosomal protein S18 acetylase RimI-like enzyme
MDLDISLHSDTVDWQVVYATLQRVGMAHYSPHIHRKAFEASHTTVFVRHGGQLIGFGRAISDGVYQAAIYDVAVVPEYQGRGIGSTIIQHILRNVPNCNVILYAAPGKEHFYRNLGFRTMKTGMALFQHPDRMSEKGFTD